jgi:hypothetical protein
LKSVHTNVFVRTNHLRHDLALIEPAVFLEPEVCGGKRVIFYAGDNADAKSAVARIIEQMELSCIDIVPPSNSAHISQLSGGPPTAINLVRF